MTNHETKFVLEACRPNGADASDPPMAAALTEAKRDPALGAWLAREQAHATVVAAKLGEVAPPAGLRDAILAGGRFSQAPQPSRMRFVPSWLVAAAAAAMLLGLGGMAWWWPWRSSAASGDLVAFAAKDTERHLMHGGHGAAVAELQRAMAEPTRRLAGATLPVNFGALRETGCRTLTVGGREVLEVCFKRDGHWFHCYVGRRGDFPLRLAAEPVFAQHGKMSVASWSDAAHVYVLASEAGRTALTRLL